VLEKQYDSLIEQIKETKDEYIVRTIDDRFFSFNRDSVALLKKIEAGDILPADNEKVALFINRILLPKGIFQNPGESLVYAKKTPKMAHHYSLIKAEAVNRLAKLFNWLFSPLLVVPLLLICFIFNTAYFAQHKHLFSYDFIFGYMLLEFMLLVPIGFACSFIHEFGHATACRKYSGRAGEIGVGFNFIFPVFFANVSNIYLISRRNKIIVALSGVYFQLIFSSIIMLFAIFYPALNKFLILNIIGIVANLVPFFRNDGYWVLNDTLRKKDLLPETFNKINNMEKLGVIEKFYAIFFILFCITIGFFMFNFVAYRGPEIITNIFEQGIFNFSTILKLILAVSYYIASTYAAITVVMITIKIFRKPTQGLLNTNENS
jgi:hypothetical protein